VGFNRLTCVFSSSGYLPRDYGEGAEVIGSGEGGGGDWMSMSRAGCV